MTSGETNGEMIPITIRIGRIDESWQHQEYISMSGGPARMTRAWKRIGHKQQHGWVVLERVVPCRDGPS